MADESKFCGECGKEYPQGNVCSHCGAKVYDEDVYCENCGRNLTDGSYADNNHVNEIVQEDEEEPRRNWGPYIIGAIALLAICGSGWWYYNSSKSHYTNNIEKEIKDIMAVDSTISVEEAVEAIDTAAADTLVSNFPKKQPVRDAYEKIVDKYIAKGESDNHFEEYYFLHDVTDDGIPELWLQVNGGESFRILSFTYKDGNALQLFNGDLGAPNHIGYHKGNGYVLKTYFSVGYQSWIKYEYKNGKIQEKEIFSEILDSNADFTEFEGKLPSEPTISPFEITNKQGIYDIVY